MANEITPAECFAYGLKELRKSRNYTQQDLADMLKVAANTVSSWENARTEPSIRDITNICIMFKIDFTDIITKGIATSFKEKCGREKEAEQ